MHLFKVENLIYFYPDREKPALAEINLVIEEGEFLLVAGESGSGKSSLARALAGLLPDFYGGRFGGKIYFRDREMRKIDRRRLAREVGMVFQDPEKQMVMTGVEAEIAFGLENLGLPPAEMFRRTAEVLSFLDLGKLREEFTANLSGGEKQKLALAAVLAMHPQVLICDEPTSQLDPAAAEDFLNLLKRLNEEMGLTVVLIEQRLERCFHLADRVLLLESGRIVLDSPPEQVARRAGIKDIPFLPPVARLFSSLGQTYVPVTVKEGRKYLQHLLSGFPGENVRFLSDQNKTGGKPIREKKQGKKTLLEASSFAGNGGKPPLAEVKNLWFTYPGGKKVLENVSFSVNAGEFVVILGENGAGKSTLLKIMAGLLKPSRGNVFYAGRELTGSNGRCEGRGAPVAYLAQNPNDYLFHDTVEEELLFTLKNFGLADDGIVDELLTKLHIERYRRTNPRDLSSGERLRVALASVLVTRPGLILLDEPTRGVDTRLKGELGAFLRAQAKEGAGVVLVTHDAEFAAEYSSRIIVISAGRIAAAGNKHEILENSLFYCPQIGKLCRGFGNGILTFDEAVQWLEPLLRAGQTARTGGAPAGASE
ncbi:MAG: ATP-binding cassette domain-containing protein [Armatimonadetes bacterium]|nr:ATP-binding cassette domain-containing protein [Armatimonadota bacterium]